MNRAARWAAALAAAVLAGAGAGFVHAVWSEAGRNRGDLFLTGIAWFGAAAVAAVGLGAIGSLFAPQTDQERVP